MFMIHCSDPLVIIFCDINSQHSRRLFPGRTKTDGVRFAAARSWSLTARYLLHDLFVASENIRPFFLSIIRWGCSSTKVTYPYQVVPFNLATQPLATQYVLPLIFKAAPDSSHCGIHDPSPFLSFYDGCWNHNFYSQRLSLSFNFSSALLVWVAIVSATGVLDGFTFCRRLD